jgi:hypothetical protein
VFLTLTGHATDNPDTGADESTTAGKKGRA